MQQDIVPQKRKSIRDIPIPDGRPYVSRFPQREKDIREINDFKENKMPETETRQPRRERDFSENISNRNSGGKGKLIFIGISVVVLIALFAFFSRSYATIYVQSKEMAVNSSVTTKVPFSTLEVTAEKNVSVKATGEEKVTEKAKGKITIFNEYEEEDQRLLKETRFESPNGLIFRIPTSVVVPGLKRDDKGNVIPGKLEVEVVADQAGEKYNISSGRFTVPGFKDLPQYNSFYAVSNSSMTGGFDGIRKVISESDRQNAEKDLKNQLKEQLIKEAQNKATDENVVVADESMIVYEILGDKVNGNDVLVSAKGTIKAVSFNSVDFGNSIAAAAINTFTTNENVKINNIEDLKILLNPDTENASVMNVDVSGNIEFKWQNNYEAFKQALAGVSKNDIDKVLEQFPGITKATSEVSPVWSGKFPEDISKIEIIDEAN